MSSASLSLSRRIIFLIGVGAVLEGPCGSICFAGLSGGQSYSWKSESSNGEYVFIGVSPYSVAEQIDMLNEADSLLSEEERFFTQATLEEIALKYTTSGMYRNDGTNTLLWTLPPLYWEFYGTPSDDGEHLVAIKEGASDSLSQMEAFRIYDRKGVVKEFDLLDLIPLPHLFLRDRLGLTSSAPRPFVIHINDAQGCVHITSNQGDTIEVLMSNGEVQFTTVGRNTLAYLFSDPRFLIVFAVVSILMAFVLLYGWRTIFLRESRK